MTNVYCFCCCFGTHDVAVNLTKNSDFKNLDKDPTLLPTLNFIFTPLYQKHWENLTVEVEMKNQEVGEKFSCLILRTVGLRVKGLVSASFRE